MNPDDRIYVAGMNTLAGSALVRCQQREGMREVWNDVEPDLTDPRAVDDFFRTFRPGTYFLPPADRAVSGQIKNILPT